MHHFFLSICVAASAQSPRQANPERPTFATHAYAVAPGYAELEQSGTPDEVFVGITTNLGRIL